MEVGGTKGDELQLTHGRYPPPSSENDRRSSFAPGNLRLRESGVVSDNSELLSGGLYGAEHC